jgi:hypothetical protein
VSTSGQEAQVIYWHGQLPPLDAEPNGDYIVEADSMRVKGDLASRGASWDRCHEDLVARLEDLCAKRSDTGDWLAALDDFRNC